MPSGNHTPAAPRQIDGRRLTRRDGAPGRGPARPVSPTAALIDGMKRQVLTRRRHVDLARVSSSCCRCHL
ncbi:putative leader peptide [Streptomyces albogriseolus]|uniref:putative leader peptide n=1 Tax=Streptomyces albogriseolus TaxID=1887 RepID=UPI003460059F